MPGQQRHGGSGRLSVADVVFVEGKCSVHNVVVGNRLRVEVCAAERGVGRLSACLPARRLPDFGMPVQGTSLFLGPSQGPAGTHLSSPCVTGGRGTAGEQRARFLVLFIIELQR